MAAVRWILFDMQLREIGVDRSGKAVQAVIVNCLILRFHYVLSANYD